MNENQRILQLANLCIGQMEQALAVDSRVDVKALKDYSSVMKTMMEIVRECSAQQLLIQPIEVIMGEGDAYAN